MLIYDNNILVETRVHSQKIITPPYEKLVCPQCSAACNNLIILKVILVSQAGSFVPLITTQQAIVHTSLHLELLEVAAIVQNKTQSHSLNASSDITEIARLFLFSLMHQQEKYITHTNFLYDVFNGNNHFQSL